VTIANHTAPLLTVITPCRDAAHTLPTTLAAVAAVSSLLDSTGHHLEHLIVDGNSQDETRQLVFAHRERYPWCGWHPGYCGGPYAGMNAGLSMARGHYIHILNADDLIINPRDYVNALLAASEHRANFILSSIVYVRPPELIPYSHWPVQVLPRDAQRWHAQLKAGLHYPHPGFVAERVRYVLQGFDLSYRYASDYKTMQSLLLTAHPKEVLVVQQPLVAMSRGGISSTWKGRLAGSQELKVINRELGINAPLWFRYLGKIIERFLPNPS